MNAIVKRWQGISLILRILVGLILGAVLGVVAPNLTILTILGDIFVGALKAVAPVLVFVLVIASLANASVGIGNRFRTVVVLYMLTTFLAAGVAVIGSFLFPVTLTLTDAAVESAPSGIAEVLRTLLNNMVTNPVTSLSSANYVGILTWAVVFGLALRGLASDSTKVVLLGMGVPTTANYVIMATTCAPILINGMGMNVIAANMFVFYFGIVADITPPVALAAYAGAAIAKSNPMKTAFNASRLAIAAFIVPYIFAFNNAMLFIDTNVFEVVQVCLTSCVGMFGIAAGIEGYMLKDMNPVQRVLSVLGGLMLIYPGTITDVCGVLVVVLVGVWQQVQKRKAAAV